MAQEPITNMPLYQGIPYIGEQDQSETPNVAVPAVLYVQTSPTEFLKVSSSNPIPVSVTQRTPTGNAETLTVAAVSVGLASIPADANAATLTAEDGDMRVFWDGSTPTATVGHLVLYGDTVELTTRAAILAFRAIRTGSTSGKLTATYYA